MLEENEDFYKKLEFGHNLKKEKQINGLNILWLLLICFIF